MTVGCADMGEPTEPRPGLVDRIAAGDEDQLEVQGRVQGDELSQSGAKHAHHGVALAAEAHHSVVGEGQRTRNPLQQRVFGNAGLR